MQWTLPKRPRHSTVCANLSALGRNFGDVYFRGASGSAAQAAAGGRSLLAQENKAFNELTQAYHLDIWNTAAITMSPIPCWRRCSL